MNNMENIVTIELEIFQKEFAIFKFHENTLIWCGSKGLAGKLIHSCRMFIKKEKLDLVCEMLEAKSSHVNAVIIVRNKSDMKAASKWLQGFTQRSIDYIEKFVESQQKKFYD